MAANRWFEKRATLAYIHERDHRFVSFAELHRLVASAGGPRPIMSEDEGPFLVVPAARRWVQAEFDQQAMLEAYLAADSEEALASFANTWALPSLIEPRVAGRYLFASFGYLVRVRNQFRLVASALRGDAPSAETERVRFDRAGAAWSVWHPIGEGGTWHPTGIRTPDPSEELQPGAAARVVLRSLATDRISEVLREHTRNTLQPVHTPNDAEFVRIADPFGTMALLLADLLIARRPMKRCELETCRRYFIPKVRSDQIFCTRSHANSAWNKKDRARKLDAFGT